MLGNLKTSISLQNIFEQQRARYSEANIKRQKENLAKMFEQCLTQRIPLKEPRLVNRRPSKILEPAAVIEMPRIEIKKLIQTTSRVRLKSHLT